MTSAGGLRRRMRPVYAAAFLQNVALWVPIEKLFMTDIGFDATAIGVMAAVYAVVVPMLEIPSGILADRWSRRGVLLIAVGALAVSVAIGGLSRNVPTYLVAALFLGVFFAMQSGTFDSIIYDTVLEETGASDAFEKAIGRLRAVESVALVAGALAGGALAEVLPLRWTYFLTVPLVLASALAVLALREPHLHQTEEPLSLRSQVSSTYRTLLQRGTLRPVIALIVLTALLVQAMLEFGPLWLVALATPAIVYGPHWAGLTGALGVGGLLGSQPVFTRTAALAATGLLLVGSAVVLMVSRSVAAIIGAQVVVTLLVVAASIPVLRRLHDAVPSTIRAGVSSGVSTLSWLVFVPFALAFGALTDRAGVDTAAWLLLAFAVGTAVLVLPVLRGAPTEAPAAVPPVESLPPVTAKPAFAADQFLPADDPDWPGHWAVLPHVWPDLRLAGDEALMAQVRAAVAGLPGPQRRVFVLRDVHGRAASEAAEALGLDHHQALELLHQARAQVRAHIDRYLREARPDDD